MTPITRELGNYPTPDQAWALLQALRWIADDPSAPTIEETSVELLLAKFLQHRDQDVREAAVHTLRLLPYERATYWLRRQACQEKDPEVIQTIVEELTRIDTTRG